LFFIIINSKQQISEASKWFTQVNLESDLLEQKQVYQLIIESGPAQMIHPIDAKARVVQTEHNAGWYSSLFKKPENVWQDFTELVKEQIATIMFLGKRVVLFHGDTYIKQKLSLCQKESVPVSVKDVFVKQRQENRKLSIEADAGQGKTSLLRHATFLIAQASRKEKKTIGFYIRADSLCNELNIQDGDESKDRSGINLEMVVRVFLSQCRSSLIHLCQQHLIYFLRSTKSSVVLLIDSLDELSQARRRSFLNRIHQISNQGMVLDDDTVVDQIVIASRPIPEGVADFNQYTIESLSDSQQKTFVMKHFGATAESEFEMTPESWETLIDQVLSSDNQTKINDVKLGNLVNTCIEALKCRTKLKTQGNPLLLFLLCLHLDYIQGKRLEHKSEQNDNQSVKSIDKDTSLFGLYESIVEMTIERSQERLHSDPRFRCLFVPWQAERSRAWLLDLMSVTAFACHWIGSQSEDTDDLCPRKDRISSVLSAIHQFEDWKLYSTLSAKDSINEELLAGQDLVDVLVALPGLCQLTREENSSSVYFVNRTIQEFLAARCALAIFDGLKFGRKSSDSWALLFDIQISGVESISRGNFWKNERIVCNKWWSRVILFAASYDHSNESGLGWLSRSIDAPNEPGIDRTDLGMVRVWHLLQALPSVSSTEREVTILDEIYKWVLEQSAIGAFRILEDNANVGTLFGKKGLEQSKKRWDELLNSKDNVAKQLAIEIVKRCELQTHQEAEKEEKEKEKEKEKETETEQSKDINQATNNSSNPFNQGKEDAVIDSLRATFE